ncbi:hypothetical protein Q5P01_004447 [Channa striata]|uniref:C-type lectin domain-containing protein n=1 Tax=Channa striata TaxID=64152 RepID=A0AA88NLC2_CHASR|nr:hypothetical protein Q5P01_004447 [Channa striata]
MKMDMILLGVLSLSGCFICSTCVFHQYHFVNVSMNWFQAQNYCRHTYTDLATTENTEELNQLISTVSSAGYSSQVWIGLYYNSTEMWTNYIGTDYLNWVNQARNDSLFVHFTVAKEFQKAATGITIAQLNVRSQLVLVNETVDWFSAWRYCRENYTDLVTDSTNLVPNGSQAWIGLIYQASSYWSDGSNSSFRYWDKPAYQYNLMQDLCAVADLQRSGKWIFVPRGTTLPFVCYSKLCFSLCLSVLKLRITSAVDLNDPDVKENLLKQFQERLQEKGVTGVTLKWREQPDGKVFHKEEETDARHDEC